MPLPCAAAAEKAVSAQARILPVSLAEFTNAQPTLVPRVHTEGRREAIKSGHYLQGHCEVNLLRQGSTTMTCALQTAAFLRLVVVRGYDGLI